MLSANFGRAAARLIRLVESEQRKYQEKPKYDEVVELTEFDPTRATDKEVSSDRHGAFGRAYAYDGWDKSMFDLVWFDSSTERAVSNMVGDDDVAWWARLHINDIPILWNSAGNQYNPDLLVIERHGTHWIVEVKMNKEITNEAVMASVRPPSAGRTTSPPTTRSPRRGSTSSSRRLMLPTPRGLGAR